MANTLPPHAAFANSYSTVPDSAAILERFFTQDQCQSLQRLFLVQQSHLFRCLYEMETHLELTLEELKRKLAKTEGQATRLLLLAETTRDGLITLSHRIDEIDSHQRRKRKRTCTTTSTHENEQATNQTTNFSSPVCSDTSTLRMWTFAIF
ncbi:hypothetical protein M378DRAFT_728832 [Amanita muscaria Koide BX008]|uniref:Uncharacterized protein n=1 Tax=Amanita muscaria (strain Koide BX008) TaxID=946122 RepID=A0A0C2T908_AMAMK|nr:hypothetical protein M378DRAFT_728832 [Amanita muscaria Koide BX008]